LTSQTYFQMNSSLLLENLTNPALLFFILGIFAVYVKSDLEIPPSTSKFISLYLLFAIGFKGGQELSHETFTAEIFYSMLLGIAISLLIPFYTFFILKKKFNTFDAGAIAASYGSVSAVTFVTAVSYLESNQLGIHGQMVAIMALMESPAIIMGLVLISFFNKEETKSIKTSDALKHSFTNRQCFINSRKFIDWFAHYCKTSGGYQTFYQRYFQGFSCNLST